jgi:hypothetical protein
VLKRFEMSISRSRRTLILGVWLLLTVAYAAIYLWRTLHLADLEGYEKDWQFQLLAFCYSRLPLMLLLLVTALVADRLVVRRS